MPHFFSGSALDKEVKTDYINLRKNAYNINLKEYMTMSASSLARARDFIANETQFHLGFLPTEQSSPLTRNLDKEFARSTVDGVANLQLVDRNVLEMAKKVLKSREFSRLCAEGLETLKKGRKIVFSGCGATGRLSILLEGMWRETAEKYASLNQYADQVFSIMTGGDFALVRSVEFFEDYLEFGREQLRMLNIGKDDMIVAITEGGETSSVLGTLEEAVNRGAKGFLLFNNPAELLAERIERSARAINDSRVTVLDLHCGPMGLAGSTRMQATSSEQLIAGAALEYMASELMGTPMPDIVADFAKLLDELDAPDSRKAMADYIDFEAAVYKKHGRITYCADDCLLDIFTDTTERSPTFMLPPFRPSDDTTAPVPWAFVKNPLFDTKAVWERNMRRPLRCLEWTKEDYIRLGAAEKIQNNPPKISSANLLKIAVGNEESPERYASGNDAAILVETGVAENRCELEKAFDLYARKFAAGKRLFIGCGDGDFTVKCTIPDTPLRLIRHMAVKLVLNNISTGTMVVMGRVTGNWMSWVDCTNKKLMDRGARLVSEIGKLSYEESCERLFEAMEIIAATTKPGEEKQSAVQYVLERLK